MKHFDEIFELAADGYGIVTAAQAREIGVTTFFMGDKRRTEPMVCHWEIDAPRTWGVQAHPMGSDAP